MKEPETTVAGRGKWQKAALIVLLLSFSLVAAACSSDSGSSATPRSTVRGSRLRSARRMIAMAGTGSKITREQPCAL